MKYQHSELISKREKLSHVQEQIFNDVKAREVSLLLVQKSTQTHREKNVWHQQEQEQEIQRLLKSTKRQHRGTPDLCPQDCMIGTDIKEEEGMKSYLNEMQNTHTDLDTDWISKWPRLIEERASVIFNQTEHVRGSNEGLRRILNGYMRHIGNNQKTIL